MEKLIKKRWAYTFIGILFGLKKEGNSTTCDTMVDLEDIMLNEINQSQKDKYCMSPLIRSI